MTFRKIVLLAIAILLPLTASAQKKKKRVVKKPPVVVVEEPQEDPRITNMREMTQQILFIDSVVVDESQILSHLILSSETGRLMTTADLLSKTVSGYAFVNEMGNKVYFSLPDDSLRLQLFTSDKLGTEWSRPQALKGLGEGISEASYPFMLNDGITFYFAAKGEESIGGYDIFLTRYDSHSGSFLKPENIGMPFNSEANDYLYAIDEGHRIGYFVTDRRQPEGKVCIYTFVPSDTRKTYDANIYSEQQIRDFADITRIADTWGQQAERNAALARLGQLATDGRDHTAGNSQTSAGNGRIVINDALTYTCADDFRSTEAAALYQKLVSARKQLDMLNSELESVRTAYAKASAADRQSLRPTILKAEQNAEQLNSRVKALEKQVRDIENKAIN